MQSGKIYKSADAQFKETLCVKTHSLKKWLKTHSFKKTKRANIDFTGDKMDLEGYAKRGLRKGDPKLLEKLTDRILEIKKISRAGAEKLAAAVITEAKATLDVKDEVLAMQPCGVTMGEFGVGSRGRGDFYAHKKIAEVIGKTDSVCDSSQMDDSGVVRAGGKYVVVTVDGMHSRLSDFPFLAGFHVTRASLRDLYVMGAKPVALLSDIHVADDGDVSKIFDYTAGIATVSDLVGVPLITGSTLRIGGDMVIGERLTGCVGAVGVAEELTARIQSRPGDVVMMSEGAGGGTVSTTALYFGMHEVVEKTLNVKFLEACKALFDHGLIGKIHAMTDVTNGGIRGDAFEIAGTAGVKLVFHEEKLRQARRADCAQDAGDAEDRLFRRLVRRPADHRPAGTRGRDHGRSPQPRRGHRHRRRGQRRQRRLADRERRGEGLHPAVPGIGLHAGEEGRGRGDADDLRGDAAESG